MKRLNVVIAPMGIVQFYDEVAKKLGYSDTENLNYDCTKISCSAKIQDIIMDYYKTHGMQNYQTGMTWVCYGPKANLDWHDFEVEVEEGFINEGNN